MLELILSTKEEVIPENRLAWGGEGGERGEEAFFILFVFKLYFIEASSGTKYKEIKMAGKCHVTRRHLYQLRKATFSFFDGKISVLKSSREKLKNVVKGQKIVTWPVGISSISFVYVCQSCLCFHGKWNPWKKVELTTWHACLSSTDWFATFRFLLLTESAERVTHQYISENVLKMKNLSSTVCE